MEKETKKGKTILPFRIKQQAILELESGLEISEICEKYKIMPQTVRNWQKQVSCGASGFKIRVRHNLSERSKVVREIRSGLLSIEQAMIKYQVKHRNTIKAWMQENSSDLVVISPIAMTQQEQEELDAVKERCKALEKALSAVTLKNAGLETLIDVAEKELKIDIRKKPGTRQS